MIKLNKILKKPFKIYKKVKIKNFYKNSYLKVSLKFKNKIMYNNNNNYNNNLITYNHSNKNFLR